MDSDCFSQEPSRSSRPSYPGPDGKITCSCVWTGSKLPRHPLPCWALFSLFQVFSVVLFTFGAPNKNLASLGDKSFFLPLSCQSFERGSLLLSLTTANEEWRTTVNSQKIPIILPSEPFLPRLQKKQTNQIYPFVFSGISSLFQQFSFKVSKNAKKRRGSWKNKI